MMEKTFIGGWCGRSGHGDFPSHYRRCPQCADREHHCHAIRCKVKTSARMFMCQKHWAMVPKKEQDKLLKRFDPVQVYTMKVSRAWVMQAMRCKLIVAEQEDIPVDLLETYKYTIEKAEQHQQTEKEKTR